ncbi:MAG: hypothetical protein JWN30_1281 [Bacilli bacterium]|nr:hypothetical protein [Bacilli bacterium]
MFTLLLSEKELRRREALSYNRKLSVRKQDIDGFNKWTAMIYHSIDSRLFKIPWSNGHEVYYIIRIPLCVGLFGFDCWFFYNCWKETWLGFLPGDSHLTSLFLIPWGICVIGWAVSYVRTIAAGSPMTFRNFARSYGWMKSVDLGPNADPQDDDEVWNREMYRGIRRRSRMILTHLFLYGIVYWFLPHHPVLPPGDTFWGNSVGVVVLWGIVTAFVQFPRASMEFLEDSARWYVYSRVWKAVNNLADMDINRQRNL